MDSQSKQVVVPTQELVTVLGTLQLASSRGAFRPEEFVQIGAAYQKLYEFLVSLGAITPPPQGNKSESEQPGAASG